MRIVRRAPAMARHAALVWFEPDPGVVTPYWALVLEDEAGPIAINWPLDLGTSDVAVAAALVEAELAAHYAIRPGGPPEGPEVVRWDLSALAGRGER